MTNDATEFWDCARANATELQTTLVEGVTLVTYGGESFTGEMVETTASGEVLGVTGYRDGLQDGEQREWYPGGTLRLEGRCRVGLAVGRWREWHPNGQLAKEQTFDNQGNYVAVKTWDEDGKLKKDKTFGGE
ncbi:toxin-antitoxin system YwqK family antitoxin [Nocardia sp. NPDC059240]|uniref:toxin-antitoxin system YwqK family antitoxin n=1 Tax=Nocardia sp. NPDC059240 TaxID=3346786 RepID=UPI0036BBE108